MPEFKKTKSLSESEATGSARDRTERMTNMKGEESDRERQRETERETERETIRQQQIQSLLDNFLGKTFRCNSEGVNLAVENLNSIFDLSASLSNLKISNRKPKKMNNDEERKNLRKQLRNQSNQKRGDRT